MKLAIHFTNFGVSIQPRVADSCGFIHYRLSFENRDPSTWTAGERWIDEQNRRIDGGEKVNKEELIRLPTNVF